MGDVINSDGVKGACMVLIVGNIKVSLPISSVTSNNGFAFLAARCPVLLEILPFECFVASIQNIQMKRLA